MKKRPYVLVLVYSNTSTHVRIWKCHNEYPTPAIIFLLTFCFEVFFSNHLYYSHYSFWINFPVVELEAWRAVFSSRRMCVDHVWRHCPVSYATSPRGNGTFLCMETEPPAYRTVDAKVPSSAASSLQVSLPSLPYQRMPPWLIFTRCTLASQVAILRPRNPQHDETPWSTSLGKCRHLGFCDSSLT